MKRILCALLSALMLVCVCSCGTKNNNTSSSVTLGEQENKTVITCADGFDSYGITHFLCTKDGIYNFVAENSDDITWSVYVLEDQFEDSIRYLPQANEVILEGGGTIYICAGQHIYIACSCNSFTSEQPNETATYSFCIEQ